MPFRLDCSRGVSPYLLTVPSVFLAPRGCCRWGRPCTLLVWLPTRWQSPLVHHSCACQAAGLTAAGSELAKLGAWEDQKPGGWKGSTCLPWGISLWAESGRSQPSWLQRRHTSSSCVSPSNISNDERRTRDCFPLLLAVHILAVGAILPNKASQVETGEGISAYASCLVAPHPPPPPPARVPQDQCSYLKLQRSLLL